jgi:hypothetical protein
MTTYQQKVDSINATMADGIEKTQALRKANQELADRITQAAQATDQSTTALAANAGAKGAAAAGGSGAAVGAAAAAGAATVPTTNYTYPGTTFQRGPSATYPGMTGQVPYRSAVQPSVGGAGVSFNNPFGAGTGATDPMVAMYMGMGYTLNEALMIASGQGAYILGKSPTQLAALGFRAAGGPVGAGTSYVVGERGPEVFTPSVAGMIYPNAAGSSTGSGGIQIIVQGSVLATQSELADLVQQAIVSAYRRGGNRLPV